MLKILRMFASCEHCSLKNNTLKSKNKFYQMLVLTKNYN